MEEYSLRLYLYNVEIATKWNVKQIQYKSIIKNAGVEIATKWNVKYVNTSGNDWVVNGRNSDKVECKVLSTAHTWTSFTVEIATKWTELNVLKENLFD